MTAKTVPYHRRNDTILGVCQAIADDVGISADWLRIAFAALFFFYPLYALFGYVGLGILVAITRRVLPDVVETKAEVSRDESTEELKLAA